MLKKKQLRSLRHQFRNNNISSKLRIWYISSIRLSVYVDLESDTLLFMKLMVTTIHKSIPIILKYMSNTQKVYPSSNTDSPHRQSTKSIPIVKYRFMTQTDLSSNTNKYTHRNYYSWIRQTHPIHVLLRVKYSKSILIVLKWQSNKNFII